MRAPGGYSWAGRPRVALLVRAAYVVIPLLAACIASAVLVHLPVLLKAPEVLKWGGVLAASTAVLVIVHRLLSRLLPLAVLLELSIEFPGPAPSRYAVARDAGDTQKLEEIVSRAQRGDPLVNLADADAARDILALVAALGSHDTQTRGHSERVRVYTDLIAAQLRLPSEDRGHLRWAALLHDVGKLRVPAKVLNKTEKLTESDWAAIRLHPAAGVRITRPLNSWLEGGTETIAQHHEKYDGTGYPLGLAGDRICLGARIVAVADAFDVMTAPRSYRKPIGRAAALRELNDCAGTHFDPRVVRAMLAVSTPRLRLAMGPLSWLGATPFLAATEGAAAVATQGTAAALVAGTVVMSGPAASATPATTAPASTANHGSGHHTVVVSQTGGSPGPAPSASSSASSSAGPGSTTQPSPTPSGSGKPTAPPGKPTASPTPKGSGKPTKSP
ncbi:MAG: HD-GYP domain-containing protein, partial [Actinomycetes bacterium]